MIKAILFDLDGTLLPLDMDLFIKAYFKGLAVKIAPHGYNPDDVVPAVYAGVAAMTKNDGTKTNEQAFWDRFAELLGEGIRKHVSTFDEFYRTEFQKVKDVCGFSEKSKKIVEKCKEKGFRVILATSPLFPQIGTESRIRWAGLEPKDFEFFTTYEDYHFCKPNRGYYGEVLERAGLKPEECLMVGNDVGEDMIAEELGMKVFLLTDCLINRKQQDTSQYPQGGFDELELFIENLNK